MSKPAYKFIGIHFPAEEVKQIDAVAASLDRTRSWMVRSLVRQAIRSRKCGSTSGAIESRRRQQKPGNQQQA